MPETPELLPCPFCGSAMVGALAESSRPGDRPGVIVCAACGACGPSLYDTPAEMARRWNGRPAGKDAAALRAVERQLRQRLRFFTETACAECQRMERRARQQTGGGR